MHSVENLWGYSSVGRALASHVRGQRFESAYLHHLRRFPAEAGGLAQLGERSLHTREVAGSSPVVSTSTKTAFRRFYFFARAFRMLTYTLSE